MATDECPLCYDALSAKGTAFYGGACGHAFHVACLNESVAAGNASACPLCRANWALDRVVVTLDPASLGAAAARDPAPDDLELYVARIEEVVGPWWTKVYVNVHSACFFFAEVTAALLAACAYPLRACAASGRPKPCARTGDENILLLIALVYLADFVWRGAVVAGSLQSGHIHVLDGRPAPFFTVAALQLASAYFATLCDDAGLFGVAYTKLFAGLFYRACFREPLQRERNYAALVVCCCLVGMVMALSATHTAEYAGLAVAFVGMFLDSWEQQTFRCTAKRSVVFFSLASVASALATCVTAGRVAFGDVRIAT
jgi:hypothetical protein